MKNAVALARQSWDGLSAAGARLPRLSRGQLLATALVGELVAVGYLLASGTVSPVLVRSLQLFLRF